MKVEDVLQCSFQSWYYKFESLTQESVILNLPESFVNSLLDDDFYLPESSKRITFDSAEPEDDEWQEEDTTYQIPKAPNFPEFEKHLNHVIHNLGGIVFPKLNWSAPKDASWMLCGNSLKCTDFSDIYLLLKSSDFITHDLTAPFALCTDFPLERLSERVSNFQPILVLRRWFDYVPDGEFRCFIYSKKLIAICQRNCDAYFQSVPDHSVRIRQDLIWYFDRKIKSLFPLDNYTVDLYWELSENSKKVRVQIIDFNVFGMPTDPLLFEWDELESQNFQNQDCLPEFRFQEDKNIHPNSMSQYNLPVDFIDIASGNDPNKLVDFIQAHIESQGRN